MAKYNYNGPEQFRPLSPWAYFGYSILFSIPLIGLIVNLVLCFSDGNINRRNFARSFWCAYLLTVILLIAAVVAIEVTDFSLISWLRDLTSFKPAPPDTI